MSKRIGVIGLGIMGSAISGNFLKAGFDVSGFDISTDAVKTFTDNGGQALGSPGEVAARSDIVLTLLPSVAALDAVCTANDGIAAAGNRDVIVMECSTLPIEDKQRNHDALSAAGVTMLDTPLSGTGAQARNKDLAVYLSGDEGAADTCGEIIDGFARAHYYVGPFGNGSKMKYVANHLVAIHNIAAAEAFVLGMKGGLEAQTIYDVIADSAGTSRMFEVRGPMMVADDYSDATMKISTWQKDMGIIGAFAKDLDCPTPLFGTCADIYTAGMAQGRASEDTAAVCAVLAEAARLKR
ncbi:MAG: NAD(P)-dependent oxidoreductase [Alphaproteobacteria bacterium]|nr:NAD(P)-dependent oxidoreductase [Alphaproteobacteria bacterium]